MSEIIEADRCDECPHCIDIRWTSWCSFGDRSVEDASAIPVWCPLDDPVLSAAYNIKRVGKPVKQSVGLDELREMAEKMGYTIERITA